MEEKMKRWLLLIGAVAPAFGGVLFISTMALAATVFGSGDAAMITTVFGGGMLGLSLLWFTVVSCWTLYSILSSGNVAADKRVLWVLGWLFANAIAVYAYIYLYVWKQPDGGKSK